MKYQRPTTITATLLLALQSVRVIAQAPPLSAEEPILASETAETVAGDDVEMTVPEQTEPPTPAASISEGVRTRFPAGQRGFEFQRDNKTFLLWILVSGRDRREVASCQMSEIERASRDSRFQLRAINSISADATIVSRGRAVYFCAYEKGSDGEWTPKSLPAIGVTQLRILTDDGEDVTSNRLRAIFDNWITAPQSDSMAVEGRDFVNRSNGRWPSGGRGTIRISINDGSHRRGEFKIVQHAYVAAGIEAATSYSIDPRDGSGAVMPLVLFLGADFPASRESDFYLGVHAIASLSLDFDDGSLRSLLGVAIGLRLDIGGYLSVGGAYVHTFSPDEGGDAHRFSLVFSFGQQLLELAGTRR